MEETLVSYQLAKLLNDLDIEYPDKYSSGFYYRQSGGEATDGYFMENGYKAPCLYFLQKWLREIHNIHICVDVTITKGWYFNGYNLLVKNCAEIEELYKVGDNLRFDTYDECLEFALYETLKLIKNINNK